MGYFYILNCGQYVGTHDGRPVTEPMDEVAIALNSEEGFLVKHGDPRRVQAYVADTKARLRAAGCAEMSDALVCITGRLPLDVLNRCIEVVGHAGHVYREAIAGRLPHLSLDCATLEAPGRALPPSPVRPRMKE